jgi:hypothetical protein
MPARSSLPAKPERRRSGPDLLRVASLRCNHYVEYELGHEEKKIAFLCRVREKARKSVKPSFSHTDAKNKEEKNDVKDVALVKRKGNFEGSGCKVICMTNGFLIRCIL